MLLCSAPAPAAGLSGCVATAPQPGVGHCQGVALDEAHGWLYFSFTTMLLKTDLQGRALGSVTGLTGHLGCLAIDAADGCVYGSLEYKTDAIGRGVLSIAGRGAEGRRDAFCVARFDGRRITRMGMDARSDSVMAVAELGEPLDDYRTGHYGCSGIDGLSFGPAFGKSSGRDMLTVAYGVYSDTARQDNDYQVLVQYDARRVRKACERFKAGTGSGVLRGKKHFVLTGNTRYGIQNLEYDAGTGLWFASVYRGEKSRWPNYSLFAIDGRRKPVRGRLRGAVYAPSSPVLTLWRPHWADEADEAPGWRMPFGQTGMVSLGGGRFLMARSGRTGLGSYAELTVWRFAPQTAWGFEPE